MQKMIDMKDSELKNPLIQDQAKLENTKLHNKKAKNN